MPGQDWERGGPRFSSQPGPKWVTYDPGRKKLREQSRERKFKFLKKTIAQFGLRFLGSRGLSTLNDLTNWECRKASHCPGLGP